jgi:hypothetical protein
MVTSIIILLFMFVLGTHDWVPLRASRTFRPKAVVEKLAREHGLYGHVSVLKNKRPNAYNKLLSYGCVQTSGKKIHMMDETPELSNCSIEELQQADVRRGLSDAEFWSERLFAFAK